jgi:Group II intron, maturase-specific domain
MNNVTSFLARRLKLKVNEAKSTVARPETRKFLGFSFSRNKEPKRRISAKALLRCKQKIRELTRRTRGISLQQMTKELAAYLRGWKSYFGFWQTPSLLKAMDKWIRHRLRSMIWKQLRPLATLNRIPSGLPSKSIPVHDNQRYQANREDARRKASSVESESMNYRILTARLSRFTHVFVTRKSLPYLNDS